MKFTALVYGACAKEGLIHAQSSFQIVVSLACPMRWALVFAAAGVAGVAAGEFHRQGEQEFGATGDVDGN